MPRWVASVSLAALMPVALAACQIVPYTGRSQLQLLSEPEENRMGLQAYREILRKSRLSRDPVANEMVTRVGTRIAAATGRTDYAWEFRVVDDNRQSLGHDMGAADSYKRGSAGNKPDGPHGKTTNKWLDAHDRLLSSSFPLLCQYLIAVTCRHRKATRRRSTQRGWPSRQTT